MAVAPTPTTKPKKRGVSDLPDPDWVARTAEQTGIPVRALSAYAGNCLFVAADGESGRIEPLADSSPIQSWAPTMTSGAVSAIAS